MHHARIFGVGGGEAAGRQGGVADVGIVEGGESFRADNLRGCVKALGSRADEARTGVLWWCCGVM